MIEPDEKLIVFQEAKYQFHNIITSLLEPSISQVVSTISADLDTY
jgi:hypothetical protein